MRLTLSLYALAAALSTTPPVIAFTGEQALAAVNASWTPRGEPPFATERAQGRPGLRACSRDLCILLTGSGAAVDAITLSGPVEPRDASARYISAQLILARLTSPGAPLLPAVTADRIAIDGTDAPEAQLGPVCMRVQRSDGPSLSTMFARRRCMGG